MKEALRCDINWPAMDMLAQDDPRLSAAIWSWAPDFPKEDAGNCAILSKDTGIENQACETASFGYACQHAVTKIFAPAASQGIFIQGENMCQRLGKEWHFKMPINASYLYQLQQTLFANHLPAVWVNYQIINKQWHVNS